MLTVRPAEVEDAPGVARVLVDGWKTTYSRILPAEFLASFRYETHEAGTRLHLTHLPSTSAVFVAVEDRKDVLGVGSVREARECPPGFTAELDALYVLPSRQRQGIGRQLLERVVGWAREQGHGSLCLWVLRDNPFRRFYEVLGAELLKEEQVRNYGGADVVAVGYGWRDLAMTPTQRPTAKPTTC